MAVDKLFDRWTFFGSGGAGGKRQKKRGAKKDRRRIKGTTEANRWCLSLLRCKNVADMHKVLLHRENGIMFTCRSKSPMLFKCFYLHAFSLCFQVMVFPFFPFSLPFPISCPPLFTKVLQRWKKRRSAGLWGLVGCFQWCFFNKSLLTTSAFFANRPSTRFMTTINGSSSPSW